MKGFLVALLVGLSLSSGVPQHLTGREYVVKEDTVKIEWGAVVHPDLKNYEYRCLMFDKEPITEYERGVTTATNHVFPRPRTGHFEFQVRACPTQGECSEWAVSTDPQYATVDGQSMGWWVFWKRTPPGGVIIEDF